MACNGKHKVGTKKYAATKKPKTPIKKKSYAAKRKKK